jgi:cell division protein FtsW
MAAYKRTDWTLFATIMVLLLFGLVVVYSASSVRAELQYHTSFYYLKRQLVFAVAGLIGMGFLMRLDYRRLAQPGLMFTLLGGTVVLLAITLAVDSQHRWIKTPLGTVQPSEFAKPVLALFLAYLLVQRQGADVNSRRRLLPVLFIVGLIVALVVFGDFGTAAVIVTSSVVVLFVAGLKLRTLLLLLLPVLLAAGVFIAAKPYRLARIVETVDPKHELLLKLPYGDSVETYLQKGMAGRNTTHHRVQARIAVGSGGILGLGLMQSRQKLFFLPEPFSDYIFSVIGEELGLWGCSAVLIGFVVLLWRGLRLFWLASDDFGRYLALGITVSIVVQAFVNMAVALDMVPPKGFPLPLISQGGTSLVATLLGLGLVLSVSEHADYGRYE